MSAIIVNLECITNMHVGNGDVNYNIIDNEVEKDPVTKYPTINASGVKGALREYFVNKGVEQEKIDRIFGKDKSGELKFLNADMIAIPVRASAGDAAYYLVSTDEAIDREKKKTQIFLNKEIKEETVQGISRRFVEGIELTKCVSLKGKELHILPPNDFRKLSLPVIARNKLENGKSVNLWYEEIVPHKSLFSFAVLAEDKDQESMDLFIATIKDQIVQFGGNSTIGYGLCKCTVEV